MPGQMRPHPAYQPYYHPQMAPMMAQYPQQYQPNWYGYQQSPMPHHPGLHQSRSYQHYPQGPPMPPQYAQHHAPLVVSSHPHAQPSPRPMIQQLPQINHVPPPPPSALQSAVSSSIPVQAPPSPPLSTPGSSIVQQKHSRTSTPVTDSAPPPMAQPVRPSSPYYPPVSSSKGSKTQELTHSSYLGSLQTINHSPSARPGGRGRFHAHCWLQNQFFSLGNNL
jgi:hypothetical protein